MNSIFSGFKKLDKIDQFGIVTGIIGLVADVIGLSSLFIISESTSRSSSSISIWIVVFLLLIYSTMLVNLFSRRSIWARNRTLKQYKISSDRLQNALIKQQKEVVEKAIRYQTYLIVIPIFIFCSIFLFLDTGYRAFSDYIGIYIVDSDIAAIMDGIVVGFLLGWIICSTINSIIRSIYNTIT